MTAAELKAYIADDLQISKKAAGLFLESLGDAIAAGLSGKGERKVTVPGIANFVKKRRKARTMTVPFTGERKRVPSKMVVSARILKKLKDQI